MKVAFSPCPNDTFVFHAWVAGRVEGAPPIEVTLADIDVLNSIAERGDADVTKVSYGALPWLLDDNRLLASGSALGRGCGPLVLTRPETSLDIAGATVAVPGLRTTAYLLFRLWAAGRGGVGRIEVMPFDRIMPAVRDGAVDAGLVIHESRFTYPSFGLVAQQDLGDWWEDDTGLAIPLGAIVARRALDTDGIARMIRASLEAAWTAPDDPALVDYVAQHAQEMDPIVQRQHIELYVNAFTADLGADGRAAIAGLLRRSADAGLVPAVDATALI